LGNNGVTPNDSGDGDTGDNNRQNFPVITAAVVSAGSVNIQGTLNSTASTSFQVDFYSNSVCDPSGFGEGARYLGSSQVTTAAGGDANFNLNFPVNPSTGQVFTAVATDPSGNSSEFAQCFTGSSTKGSVSFSQTDVTVSEGAGVAILGLTRTGGSVGSLSVDYVVRNGTATVGSDFLPTQGAITFADGETTKMLTVPLIDDNVNELPTETAMVVLSGSSDLDVVGPQSTASLRITDDDQPPSISIGDVSSAEGDSGSTAFNFPVTLSGASAQQVTVFFQTADGTAIGGGNDFFLPQTNSITFAPGETTATITIQVKGDLTTEPDETFFVNLSAPTNATIADAQGKGTIVNDDSTPTVSLSVNDVSVIEGNSGTIDAVFTVTLSGTSTKTVTADIGVSGGTASTGSDYQSSGPQVSFAPGQTIKTFAVTVIGDTVFEGNETFQVQLINVVNANVADGIGVGTIIDDETQPTLSVNDIMVVEGDNGTSDAVFTVSLSGTSQTSVGFAFNLTNGTAIEHEDFSGIGGGGSIPPGLTSNTFTVPIIGDTITEGDENFFMNISDPNNATISDNQGVCTIKDNEGPTSPHTFQFATRFINVSESAGSLEIVVTRSGNASAAATVDYATEPNPGGGASDRNDYTLALGTLRFGPGETTKSFTVLLTDDVFVEGRENILTTLSNPTGGATFGQPSTSIITIEDNDVVPPTSNPIDGTELFVRQHYHDFLNREADASGLAFWQNEITQCGSDQQCVAIKRINVSAAFFLSIEFQETGYLVYRFYKSGFGNLTGASVPVRFTDFLRDTQEIGKGVRVGIGDWQTQLENNKQSFALAFVQRTEFITAFPESMTGDQFVTKLDTNAGGVLSAGEKANLVALLGAAPSDGAKRAQVLRAVAEDQDLKNAEFNKAFVLMQYFGYLRRNPNDAPDSNFSGYDFWLGKLNQFGGNFVQAEMVKAFLESGEYRHRFGS
jgi:hypothetical protein